MFSLKHLRRLWPTGTANPEDPAKSAGNAAMRELWKRLVNNRALLDRRPSYAFDPDYYLELYPWAQKFKDPYSQYQRKGRHEGQRANRYSVLAADIPNLASKLCDVITDADLLEALQSNQPDSAELTFELLLLPGMDEKISTFSAIRYGQAYPDVLASGAPPVLHYLRHGLEEGRNRHLGTQAWVFDGAHGFDAAKPTCLILQHELSRTGSPIVGRDIAESASATHNVILVARQDGSLRESVLPHCCQVIISQLPDQQLDNALAQHVGHIDLAIANSAESIVFAPFLTRHNIRFALYIHEFAGCTLPRSKRVHAAALADILVFSSHVVLQSWKDALDDLAVDIDRDVLVLPQTSLVRGLLSSGDLKAARKRISGLIGRDCSSTKIVYGAGHAGWRKGTDLFVQAAQLVRKRDPDTIFIWIGDGFNHEDYLFGTWIEDHLVKSGANGPDANLYVLPPGEYYEDLCRAADVLFMSSRRDPLPNVVFDAYFAGCEILRFSGTSGFDDDNYADADGLHIVDYCDVEAAAQALTGLPQKQPSKNTQHTTPLPNKGPFEEIAGQLNDRTPFDRGASTGDFDIPVMSQTPGDQACERQKLWHLGRRFVWQSLDDARAAVKEHAHTAFSFVDIQTISDKKVSSRLPAFSVCLHVHRLEELKTVLEQPNNLKKASDLFVTVADGLGAKTIKKTLSGAGLNGKIITRSSGEAPVVSFFKLVQSNPNTKLWLNLNLDNQWGYAGQQARLTRQLLLEESAASLSLLRQADTGLVTGFNPLTNGWDGSNRVHAVVEKHMPFDLPDHPLLCPDNNSVWVKSDVVVALMDFFGENHAWPPLNAAQTGTEFDLIERLWILASASKNLKSVFLNRYTSK